MLECFNIKYKLKHMNKSRNSSVSIALGYGLNDQGSMVQSWQRQGIFLFTTVSRTALGPT